MIQRMGVSCSARRKNIVARVASLKPPNMIKNKIETGQSVNSDPRFIERGTPEYFARILETHIKYFTPTGWCEPIRSPMVPPYIEVADWLVYKKGFDEGTLEAAMEGRPVSQGPGRWMIREAIEAFFKQGKHNEK